MTKPKRGWFCACASWLGMDVIPKRSMKEILIPVLGAFLAQVAVFMVSASVLSGQDVPILVASMGAAGVLLFAAPHSPLVQPYPVFMGHLVSVTVGVTCAQYIPNHMLAGAVAVAGAILLMLLTRSLHPPGGAAAISAVIGGNSIHSLGYWFVLAPVMLNVLILLISAVVINRLLGQEYPWRRDVENNTDVKQSNLADDIDQEAG
ncbi:MAG: HPP family protein [Gammaproteobacteria bacterium]|nr:HPP family protein [Gammaproteobacteria bacterium]